MTSHDLGNYKKKSYKRPPFRIWKNKGNNMSNYAKEHVLNANDILSEKIKIQCVANGLLQAHTKWYWKEILQCYQGHVQI